MVLDGGLATALESAGYDLEDELWSAKILLEAPEAIRQVHREFLLAGADCITTSSYQASFPGFHKRGLRDSRTVDLLRDSVRLAVDAREAFWSERGNRRGRRRPLVAASVGPYGAFLADGSEYTGHYDVDDDGLYVFHRSRWQVLASTQADLLACETIPSRREVSVLLRLLRETPESWAWLSFSCRDSAHLCDGSRLAEVAQLCDVEPRVAAVGINCTAPELIAPLIKEARQATSKPVIVYPNSGGQYNASRKRWEGDCTSIDLAAASTEWVALGAVAVGGCCRVGPQDIAEIRRRLISS
jgi:homocysteine S-methyltransferase